VIGSCIAPLILVWLIVFNQLERLRRRRGNVIGGAHLFQIVADPIGMLPAQMPEEHQPIAGSWATGSHAGRMTPQKRQR
jgi:hypothetical protein